MKRLLIVLCMASLVAGFGASSAWASGHPSASHSAGANNAALMAAVTATHGGTHGLDPLVHRVPSANRSFAAVGGSNISNAIELPDAVVYGTVNSGSHSDDVYKFYLEAGATVYFSLDATAGTHTQLWLYPPSAVNLESTAVDALDGSTFPQADYYTAPVSGVYYFDVWSGVGSSSTYALDYLIDAPNDDIPGVPVSASPIYNWMMVNWNRDDVYRLPLRAGDQLSVSLDAAPSASNTGNFNLDLYVYNPSFGSMYDGDGYGLVPTAWSEHPSPAVETLSLKATQTGNYYVDVYTAAGDGYSSLSWSVTPVRPSIARTPTKSALTYKRKKGKVVFTLASRVTNQFALPVTGARVYLQTSTNGKKWKNKIGLNSNSNGAVAVKVTAKKKGKTYFRWYRPATSTSVAAYTGAQKVTIK